VNGRETLKNAPRILGVYPNPGPIEPATSSLQGRLQFKVVRASAN